MSDFYTDPDGQRWRKTRGYSGYRIGPDGSMVHDIHTGSGLATYWIPVLPPRLCEHCDTEIGHDVFAKAHHYRTEHDIDIFKETTP